MNAYRHPKFGVSRLEEREVPTVGLGSTGLLTVEGTMGPDQITVAQTGSHRVEGRAIMGHLEQRIRSDSLPVTDPDRWERLLTGAESPLREPHRVIHVCSACGCGDVLTLPLPAGRPREAVEGG